MFWTKRVFSYADGVAVEVRDVTAAQQWYAEKMGFQYSSTDLDKELGDMVLGYSPEEIFLALVKVSGRETRGRDARHPPIIFAKKLAAAHEYLSTRGVDIGPVQEDSGGNHFFRFRDLDGNELEVCVEP